MNSNKEFKIIERKSLKDFSLSTEISAETCHHLTGWGEVVLAKKTGTLGEFVRNPDSFLDIENFFNNPYIRISCVVNNEEIHLFDFDCDTESYRLSSSWLNLGYTNRDLSKLLGIECKKIPYNVTDIHRAIYIFNKTGEKTIANYDFKRYVARKFKMVNRC